MTHPPRDEQLRALERHLRQQGFDQLPSPLSANLGDSSQEEMTASQIESMARCLAALHSALAGFNPKKISEVAPAFGLSAPEIQAQRQTLIERLDELLPEELTPKGPTKAALIATMTKELDAFPLALYREVREASEPTLVHGDFRRSNLRFGGNFVVSVHGWPRVFSEVRLWDVCYAALSLSGVETLGAPTTPERGATFIRIYHNAAPFSDAEVQLMPSYLVHTVIASILTAPDLPLVRQRLPLLRRLLISLAEDLVDMSIGL